MRILVGTLLAMLLFMQPLLAALPWHAVLHKTKPQDYYLPVAVTLRAEQATLATDRSGRTTWYGYTGPTNLHTRDLSFSCQGTTYAVPESFVTDLLWLNADDPIRASINGRDVVFSLTGCDGEKGYTVHFHFRDGRFSQRILSYSEARNILIRTNDA